MRVKPTARPVSFQGDLRNLPDALAPLKELPNWVCWRWEWRVAKNGIGKFTKPPFQPKNPQHHAKNNDPSTWGTYEQALGVFEAGQCDGIGFNLSGTDVAAFDIDKCRDPATGDVAPEAMAIVDRTTSYTEITVSGTGLRVVGYGTGRKLHRKQRLPGSAVEIESYRGAERYIVITGNPLPQTWAHMADIDGKIDAVVAQLEGRKDDARHFKLLYGDGRGDVNDRALPPKLVQLITDGVSPSERPKRRIPPRRLLAGRVRVVGNSHRKLHCRQEDRPRSLRQPVGERDRSLPTKGQV
jgi:primase-polymerase (primpol)-like protein